MKTDRKFEKEHPFLFASKSLISTYMIPPMKFWCFHEKMGKYKDRYIGKRCFIVGNGPSLRANDLDRIKNEVSFATNSIYRVFSKTEWRPSFYCIEDNATLDEMQKENVVEDVSSCTLVFFVSSLMYRSRTKVCDRIENLIALPVWNRGNFASPRFSMKAGWLLYDAFNVTYMAIQVAAYMGFSDIILIGVDNDFPYVIKRDGRVLENNRNQPIEFWSSKNIEYKQTFNNFYDSDSIPFEGAAFVDRGNDYYDEAEKFSRRHESFRIYNATRGGKLEAFERTSLDALFGD